MTPQDDLELAFSLHMADLIIGVDDTVDPGEKAFLEENFPKALLVEKGFIDGSGERTDAYHEAAMEALDTLPAGLDDERKLSILKVFAEAVRADGEVDPDEARALVDGARLLEVEENRLATFLTAELGITLDEL